MVLDAELVAIDRDKANELKSFQELSTRARGAIAASEVHNFSPSTISLPCHASVMSGSSSRLQCL